jgi:leucyl-tRNA synthetase
VQVNGKVRAKMDLPADLAEAELKQKVLADPNVQKYLQGQTPEKIIVVPNKLVSIVI